MDAHRQTTLDLLDDIFGPIRPRELSLAESYIHGHIDIEGDVETMARVGERLMRPTRSWRARLDLVRRLLQLPANGVQDLDGRNGSGHGGGPRLSGARHCAERDRQAVTWYYDVSNEPSRLVPRTRRRRRWLSRRP